MPTVMGGFTGGPGSRYQIVRTNYIVARLFPGTNYNDTGATNFLTLMNQLLPNDMQADYLCFVRFSSATPAFRDAAGVSPNIIELEGHSGEAAARLVPLIGPNYPNLGANSGYTAYVDGVATAASADTMTRAKDLMRKTNGVIQDVLSTAVARLEVIFDGTNSVGRFNARNVPLLNTDQSPLDDITNRLMQAQYLQGTGTDPSGGSMIDIRTLCEESSSGLLDGVNWNANRLSVDWRPDSAALTTNFIPRGNAQERSPTTLADVFSGKGSVGDFTLTNAGTGYTAGDISGGLTGSEAGQALTVKVESVGGSGEITALSAGSNGQDLNAVDPGLNFVVGETVTLTSPSNGVGTDAVITLTSVTNIFGFISVIGIVDTHPPNE
jgi:hypothetical protein